MGRNTFYAFILGCCLMPQAIVATEWGAPLFFQVPDSVLINHKISENSSVLIFPNLLLIPKENYGKFFHRMKNMYPEIVRIERDDNKNEIQVYLNQATLAVDLLDSILIKFSIKSYTLKTL